MPHDDLPKPRLKRARREAAIAFTAEPDALETIIDQVADDATTLHEFCRARNLSYSYVHAWLHDKSYPERISAYAQALESRDRQLIDRVQTLLREVAEVDIRSLYDERGELLPVHEIPEAVARAVGSIDVTYDDEGTATKKIKLNDRLRGADMLGKSLGMFKDRVEVSGAGGGPIRTEEVGMNEAARRVAFLLSSAVRKKSNSNSNSKGD